MGSNASRRAALAALVALAIYALACWFPGAWSPDSSRVVLPVFAKEGVARLVMVDLEGKAVREVARIGSKHERLSAAAWSPDGQWIAYMRFVSPPPPPKPKAKPDKPKAKGTEPPVTVSLMLQDARSGKTRRIWSGTAPGKDKGKGYIDANQFFGPGWLNGSRSLAIQNMSPAAPAVLVLDTTGRVQRQVPLKGGLSSRHVSLSPDGRHVAYVAKRTKDKDMAVYLARIDPLTPRELGPIGERRGPDGLALYPRPAWTPDSRWLYFAQTKKPKSGEAVGLVNRVDVTSGRTDTVWRKRGATPIGIGVSAKTNLLAVDYTHKAKGAKDMVGIDVLDPTVGRAVPVHLSREGSHHYSTAISPDGKWVAFCPISPGPDTGFGVITSSDGAQLRLFVPDPSRRRAVGQVVRARLEATLMVACAGREKELEASGLTPGKINTVDQANKWLDLVVQGTRKQDAPIFREAETWGPVALCSMLIEAQSPDKRDRFVALARQRLAAARAVHPDHPFGPALEHEIERILTQKPKKPSRAPSKKK